MAGPREQVFVAQPLAYAGQRVIASPFQFATTEDDNLRIVSANSLAGVVLAIQGRRVTTAGNIEPFAYVHTPNSDRSSRTEHYKLGAGALLNLVIFAVSGSPIIGQTFVSAQIIRGLSAATVLLGGLLAGYVTASQPLAFPGSPIDKSTSEAPPRVMLGTQPAAGAEIAETVPTGARWQLISVDTLLTTSATAGNRRPSLILDGGVSQRYARSPQAQTLAASLSKDCYWMAGMPHDTAITADALTAGLPVGVVLLAGHRFVTATESLAVGDQYGAPRFQVRETLEVQA